MHVDIVGYAECRRRFIEARTRIAAAARWDKQIQQNIQQVHNDIPVERLPGPPKAECEAWLQAEKREFKSGPTLSEFKRPRPTVEVIQKITCEEFSSTRADLLSRRRTHGLVRPRHIAMYLCRWLTLRSMPEIGRRFGGRDHTTVLNAVRRIGEFILTDENVAKSVRNIIFRLEKYGFDVSPLRTSRDEIRPDESAAGDRTVVDPVPGSGGG